MDVEEVELPSEYYVYTVLMIILVISAPLFYRQIWLAVFDTVQYYRLPKDRRGGPLGCQRFGKPGNRNLSREFEASGQSNGHPNGNSENQVKALFVYPIKSCYPVEIEESTIAPTGFQYDRQFCFAQWYEPSPKVGDQNGHQPEPKKGSTAYWNRISHWHFMTQRQNPSLTHLKIEIWIPDPDSPHYNSDDEIIKSGGCIIISFTFSPPATLANLWTIISAKLKGCRWSAQPVWRFQIPLNPTAEQIKEKGYGTERVAIWRDQPNAVDMTSEIPKHVLQQLQNLFREDAQRISPNKFNRQAAPPELRLFRVDTTKDRNVYKNAPTEEQLGYQAMVGFQDSVSCLSTENILPHANGL